MATMFMCHWLAMETILCALCVILAAPTRHMKNPLSCTAEPTCTQNETSSTQSSSHGRALASCVVQVHQYQEIAGVGEALGVPGGQRDEKRAELAHGDGDEAADDEGPVAVAGGEQLLADAAVLGVDLGSGGARLDVEHVVDALEAQDLELAGEAEQHAHQQEHPRAVHPRRQCRHQRHGVA
jgi:hypothetical protein